MMNVTQPTKSEVVPRSVEQCDTPMFLLARDAILGVLRKEDGCMAYAPRFSGKSKVIREVGAAVASDWDMPVFAADIHDQNASDEAIEKITAGFMGFNDQYGPDSVAIFDNVGTLSVSENPARLALLDLMFDVKRSKTGSKILVATQGLPPSEGLPDLRQAFADKQKYEFKGEVDALGAIELLTTFFGPEEAVKRVKTLSKAGTLGYAAIATMVRRRVKSQNRHEDDAEAVLKERVMAENQKWSELGPKETDKAYAAHQKRLKTKGRPEWKPISS